MQNRNALQHDWSTYESNLDEEVPSAMVPEIVKTIRGIRQLYADYKLLEKFSGSFWLPPTTFRKIFPNAKKK